MSFVLSQSGTLEQEGAYGMVAPPHQCAEGELIDAVEVFGTVEILIGTFFQTFAFDQLPAGLVESSGHYQGQSREVPLQGRFGRLEHPAQLGANGSLLAELLGIRQ